MFKRSIFIRMTILLEILVSLALLSPPEAFSFPEAVREDLPFNQLIYPFMKTLMDYDSERNGIKQPIFQQARDSFKEGVVALQKYEYRTAREAFIRSLKDVTTYTATFNLALSYQLEHEYSDSKQHYIKAKSLISDDPELLSNLGTVCGKLGETEDSIRFFDEALSLNLSKNLGLYKKGRILLQLSKNLSSLGLTEESIQSLQRSYDAFLKSKSKLGESVARAKQGIIFIGQEKFSKGEKYLKDAIAKLQEIGAYAEEAVATIDLSGFYLAEGNKPEEAKTMLTRAIEISKEGGYLLEHARALNNMGIYYLNKKNTTEALSIFNQALKIYEIVRDPRGNGDALNNAAACYLMLKQDDKALDFYYQALNYHIIAGLGKKVAQKAINIAALLINKKKPQPAIILLEMALKLNNEIGDPHLKGAALFTLAHAYLSTDLGLAYKEAKAAKKIFDDLKNDKLSIEAQELLTSIRKHRIFETIRIFFLIAGFIYILYKVYIHRSQITVFFRRSITVIASFWQRISTTFHTLMNRYESRLARMAGLEIRTNAEIRVILEEKKLYEKKNNRTLIIILIGILLIGDFFFITLPNLNEIAEIKNNLARGLLPMEVIDYLRGALNTARFHVIIHYFSQAILFILCIVIFRLLEVLIHTAAFRAVRGLGLPSEVEYYQYFTKNQIEISKRFYKWIFVSFACLYLSIVFIHGKIDLDPIHVTGIGFVTIYFFFEVWLFRNQSTLIRSYSFAKPGEVYNWLFKVGIPFWCSKSLAILGLIYVCLPAIYYIIRYAQKLLLYPQFEKNLSQFSSFLYSIIGKYHFLIFEGNTALILARLEDAYEPISGMGGFWTSTVVPFLPYAFYALFISLIFRVLLPYLLSLMSRRRQLFAIFIGILCCLINIILTKVLSTIFAFKFDNLVSWTVGTVFITCFTIYLTYYLNREWSGIECPNCDCKNADNANYCNQCGLSLRGQN